MHSRGRLGKILQFENYHTPSRLSAAAGGVHSLEVRWGQVYLMSAKLWNGLLPLNNCLCSATTLTFWTSQFALKADVICRCPKRGGGVSYFYGNRPPPPPLPLSHHKCGAVCQFLETVKRCDELARSLLHEDPSEASCIKNLSLEALGRNFGNKVRYCWLKICPFISTIHEYYDPLRCTVRLHIRQSSSADMITQILNENSQGIATSILGVR